MLRMFYLMLFVCTTCWGIGKGEWEAGISLDLPGEYEIHQVYENSIYDTDTSISTYIEYVAPLYKAMRVGLGLELQYWRTVHGAYGDHSFRFIPVYLTLKFTPKWCNVLQGGVLAHCGWNFYTYINDPHFIEGPTGLIYFGAGFEITHASGVNLTMFARRHIATPHLVFGPLAECWITQTNWSIRLGYRF